ncbi:fibronectin type III domain-containing protein [Paenibacillus sp. RC67]|uniref:pectate lyase family protein n=1 Tax=Paenibacillus sp. RC67 TaxID=3039392 RepID=UPI0032C23901
MKHRKLNKIFAIILTLTLVLSLLPQIYVPAALAAATNLPSGWNDVAMNDGISSGNAMVKSTSASYDSTTQAFTIAGSEGKLQSTGDSAYFVNTTIGGDFVATVRVASFAPFGTQSTTTTSQAMLMLKNGTTKTSNGFFAVFNSTNVVAYKRYTSTGTVNANPAITATAPFYLRLEKVGNKYNTYYSKDGSSFGTAYATITDSTYVIDSANNNAMLNIGLAVTEANVKFDNLVIKRPDGTVLFGQDPVTPPNAPTGLTVVNPGSNATVNLSWNAASGAASYTIRRGTQSGVYTDLATIPSSSTTYADTTAVNGTPYFYVVTAKNSSGLESASTSNEVSDTPVLPKPNVPTGLTANAGDAQITLNWNAAAGAQSYTVKYATTSGGPYTSVTGITSNSYTLTDLMNNTTYYLTVFAVNDAGPSQDAAEVQAIPMTLPPPQAPTGVQATGADTKVNVSWSAVNGANSYSVKRSTDGQSFTTVAAGVTGTSYTDTGLTNGTTYYYVVTAVNPQGESGNSAIVSAAPAQMVVGSPVITKSGGWFETAYVEWAPVSNSQGYNVYVKPASASDSQYVQMDTQLIRQYPTYWRADAVGLPSGDYVMKVEALLSDGSSKNTVSDTLSVMKHDRSGFAFSSQSPFKTGSGAYNDDGSLRSNAQVIYVTSETAQTVTLDVITNSKGAKTTGNGIGDILKLRQKGYDKTPLAIRFIGQITKDNMRDQLNSSGYLEVKGNAAYSEMNMTLEGIGEDTYAYGWGFLVRNAGNVELRNIGMMRFPDDAFSMDTKNVNVWVHNNDLFYGDAGSDADQVKGDGSTDIKGSSTYITISYNHYWDSGKSSLSGLSEPTEYFVTYHHNWFDHSDSRHPRVRVGTIHVYNNYYDGVAKYGVGATTGSSIFVESNYWRNAHDPMMISLQGTDIKDGVANGTFSSENGGMIKAYNNIITNPNSLIYANSDTGTAPANPTSFDAYLASSRNETVPSTYKALVGGAAYNNFDTLIETAVNPANIDDVNHIPQMVTTKAGRLNQGDFTWQFDNSVDDASYVVNTALKNKTLNYKTQLVAVGGNSTQQTTPAPNAPTGLTATAGNAQGSTDVDGSERRDRLQYQAQHDERKRVCASRYKRDGFVHRY